MKTYTRNMQLDFHTSEFIDGVGKKFDKHKFQRFLKDCKTQTINLFAKCHHGWFYYPSEIGQQHPGLNFDLLKEQVDAAHEIGVDARLYIPCGWSAYDAKIHPEWRSVSFGTEEYFNVNYDENAKETDAKPNVSWQLLCLSGTYREELYHMTEELCDKFEILDGLFFDICTLGPCVCENCKKGMAERGLNPEKYDDAMKYFIESREEVFGRIERILHSKHPNASLFFNGTAIPKWLKFHVFDTHYELENLPTTSGEYDKFVVEAAYFKKDGKPIIGMTGKFNTDWGEFGGYKLPDALKYECATMMMNGAGCCIGEQLLPSGACDDITAELIGNTFSYIEKLEPYFDTCAETTETCLVLSGDEDSDLGMSQLLLDSGVDFAIGEFENSLQYDTLIFPNGLNLTPEQGEALSSAETAGKRFIILGGFNSQTAVEFMRRRGAEYIGKTDFEGDYLFFGEKTEFGLKQLYCNDSAYAIKADEDNCRTVVELQKPYFKRTYGKYCSHRNAPPEGCTADYPAMAEGKSFLYFGHLLGKLYRKYGSAYFRKYFMAYSKKYLEEKAVVFGLPSAGRKKLYFREKENEFLLHLTYGQPVTRGVVKVLEDFPEIHDVKIELKIEKEIKEIRTLSGDKLQLHKKGSVYCFTLPKLRVHELIIIKCE